MASRLDPAVCRKHVETSFTVDLMAAGYEAVYQRTVGRVGWPPVTANGQAA